ncbi:molybdopterin-dependent oxidoreductase [Hephaestia caeni]|uniref:molybdopterin-dependent oxidoreductase n=1 Tax=Hephaestia caeni TaxID=645617 RepID=UPI00319E29F0
MGNARWLGVSLRHILDLAGVRPDAVVVRFGALDQPLVAGAPDFEKSLAIDHARDGEVMLAFGMNGDAASAAQRLPSASDRARSVFDLLGQDAQRHRGFDRARRSLLDGERLQDSR